MPFFIPVDIAEYKVKLVARKLLGSAGPGGTDPEALHGWKLKFRDQNKKLRISVESSVECLANQSPP